jgi:hypothetical protein
MCHAQPGAEFMRAGGLRRGAGLAEIASDLANLARNWPWAHAIGGFSSGFSVAQRLHLTPTERN